MLLCALMPDTNKDDDYAVVDVVFTDHYTVS